MYLLKPSQLLELVIEKSIDDSTFEMSETWMSVMYRRKIVLTYNIEKVGDDITVSIRLLYRKEGNSMKHTYPIANVGVPVSECYKNEKITKFNDKYPTGNILQGWVDDSFFVPNCLTTSNHQCRSIMFQPIPKNGVCENQKISVDLLSDMVA